MGRIVAMRVWSQVVDNHLLPTTVGATGILAQMMTSQDRCPSLRQLAPHSVSPVPTVFDHTLAMRKANQP
ncbi:MAG: hypothetical protein GDA56_24605 [Hormoscilla sp. GM7CHS1pb]|nr:hypothetical protein [Hormoscilla sp. GM7CHS1pb]MBC6480482.1 hypothetical protein [Hormoscilla sp. GM7CHS1pb]